jgi:hypothetical protein
MVNDWHSGKDSAPQIKIGGGWPAPYLRGMSETAKAAPKPETTGSAGSGEKASPARPKEIGGPPGPEPTRYGDWERNGRCVDF